MPKIKINDLPMVEDLSPEEVKGIVGGAPGNLTTDLSVVIPGNPTTDLTQQTAQGTQAPIPTGSAPR